MSQPLPFVSMMAASNAVTTELLQRDSARECVNKWLSAVWGHVWRCVWAQETDFGARTTHALMTKAVGTLLWMAPELLSDDTATYNQAIDVYSYGVVLWEIWSRVLPFEELNSSNSYIEFYEHFRTEVCGGHRPPVPPHDADPDAPPFYADLVQRCWSGVPLSRPSFSGVLQTLEGDARSYSNTWR
eukprot:m.1527888 g.1527888  ORF g.1527888 m.1527888 type:complete len:186 (+) comp25236_c2_seq5:3345-3902(+)